MSGPPAGGPGPRPGSGSGAGAGPESGADAGSGSGGGPGASPDAGGQGLPAEAYASALAGLPGMGPARLTAVLDAAPPAVAWARVRQGRPWREPAVAEVLGSKGSGLLSAWRTAAAAADVVAGWQRLVDSGIGVVLRGRPGYPPILADDVEPPALLFHEGRPDVLDGGPRVAVVGTRRCTHVGQGVAFELGRDLAGAGVSVVSGLAHGIDAAAHRGALQAGGAPPIGVVGTGLDVVYPKAQRVLWRAVAEAGVLLSESPLGTAPERWRFPARNRIIAALADVVVVVESHVRGGALHTVDEADRRGIDVVAVPGSVRNHAAAGVNALLVEGRAPVRDAEDVLLALGLSTAGRSPSCPDPRPAPSDGDRLVLDALGWQPSSLDQLAIRTTLALPALAAALERLRAGGWVSQTGGWYEQVAPGAAADGVAWAAAPDRAEVTP
jgi:DNA processing protein